MSLGILCYGSENETEKLEDSQVTPHVMCLNKFPFIIT